MPSTYEARSTSRSSSVPRTGSWARCPCSRASLNPHGVAHAGALLWFADVCATSLLLGASDPASGAFPLAIQLSAAFLANQRDGVFRATLDVREARPAG